MRAIIVILILFFNYHNVIAQNSGFKKDSLQLKVYTEIEYIGSRTKAIEVTKVFCDYCDAAQIEFVKKFAWRKSYERREESRFKAKNGIAKLTLFIRVDREEFSRIKENE